MVGRFSLVSALHYAICTDVKYINKGVFTCVSGFLPELFLLNDDMILGHSSIHLRQSMHKETAKFLQFNQIFSRKYQTVRQAVLASEWASFV